MKHYLIVIAALALSACGSDFQQPQAASVPSPEYSVFSEGLIADITPKDGWRKYSSVRRKDLLAIRKRWTILTTAFSGLET